MRNQVVSVSTMDALLLLRFNISNGRICQCQRLTILPRQQRRPIHHSELTIMMYFVTYARTMMKTSGRSLNCDRPIICSSPLEQLLIFPLSISTSMTNPRKTSTSTTILCSLLSLSPLNGWTLTLPRHQHQATSSLLDLSTQPSRFGTQISWMAYIPTLSWDPHQVLKNQN